MCNFKRLSINTVLMLLMVIAVSCNSSKKILYFQDAEFNVSQEITNLRTIKIEPQDQISITVTCRDPEITALFNLVTAQRLISPGGETSYNGNTQLSTYTVNAEGNINFPELGEVHVAGLTREEVAKTIKEQLVSKELVKDPIITVEYINLRFSAIGEVAKPGQYKITTDQLTLLEALSLAGDLTIYGKRDRVFVIREEEGKRVTYNVDLRSKDTFESPVYYLRQNDIIYVEPNKTRVGQSSVNENTWKSASIYISIASVLTSIAVLLFK